MYRCERGISVSLHGAMITTWQTPGPSWQMPFVHACAAGQPASSLQATSTQPCPTAETAAFLCASAGSQRFCAGQRNPSSHGIGSQAPAALQRKPVSQAGPPLHDARHSEPMPIGLHASENAWQVAGAVQSVLAAQPVRGGMPQLRGSLGPAHSRPLTQSFFEWHALPLVPQPAVAPSSPPHPRASRPSSARPVRTRGCATEAAGKPRTNRGALRMGGL